MTGPQSSDPITEPTPVVGPPAPADPAQPPLSGPPSAPAATPPVSESAPGARRSGGVQLRMPALLAILLATALVGGVLGGLLVRWAGSGSTASGGSCDAVTLSDQVLPSVVTIAVSSGQSASNGSGEFIKDGGYILTNDHVISPGVGGGTFTVLMSGGHTAPATLVGRAPDLDLAVIKIDTTAKTPVIAVARIRRSSVSRWWRSARRSGCPVP